MDVKTGIKMDLNKVEVEYLLAYKGVWQENHSTIKNELDSTVKSWETIINELSELGKLKETRSSDVQQHLLAQNNYHEVNDTNKGVNNHKVNDTSESNDVHEVNDTNNSNDLHEVKLAYKCGVCWKSFISEDECLEHKLEKHPFDNTYRCMVCKNEFTESCELEVHLKSHGATDPEDNWILLPSSMMQLFQCNDCGQRFKCMEHLIEHSRIHCILKQPIRPVFLCKDCGEGFTCKKHLKEHSRTHRILKGYRPNKRCTPDKQYQCDFCGEVLESHNSLKSHVKVHRATKNPYICSICDKRFRCISKRDHHYVTHLSEKLFQCQFCEKCYKRDHDLKRHIKTHIGEKPKESLSVHSGAKPYECNTCGRRLSTHKKLTRHIEIYCKKSFYKCDQCNKEFLRLKDVNTHSCLLSQ